MNASNAENDGHQDAEAIAKGHHRDELAILNLFRLLETAVQTSKFHVGGQIVAHAHEIVGLVKSAKASFEEHNPKALTQINQGAEGFRVKVVRWEAEARAAQAGNRRLDQAQKRKLPAEIATVRSACRKTHIFFERLASALGDWSYTTGLVDEPVVKPDENKATRGSVYDRGHWMPTSEPTVKRKTNVSVEGLHMMTMMVGQQFEELSKLFDGARNRDVGAPLHSALDAFNEGHYLSAKSRLALAHEAFVQAANTGRMGHVEIVEAQFETLLQGTSQLAEATNQRRETMSFDQEEPVQTAVETAFDPQEDLLRLQQILQHDLVRVFPASSSNELRKDATKYLQQITSGPVAKLPENLKALLRALNYGADDSAAETKVAKEIIKRLGTRTPEEIRPSRKAKNDPTASPTNPVTEDEDEITLDFAMPSSESFTVDPVELKENRVLELQFQNDSKESAHLRVQIYNAAQQPLLTKSAKIQLPATSGTESHTADIASIIDSTIDDTLAVRLEVDDVPDDVEISTVIVRDS